MSPKFPQRPHDPLPEVGDRIMLQDSHPWAGKVCTVTSHDMLIIGTSAKVRLEGAAFTECYVRYQKDWRQV